MHCEVVLRIIDTCSDLTGIKNTFGFFKTYAKSVIITDYNVKKKYGVNSNNIFDNNLCISDMLMIKDSEDDRDIEEERRLKRLGIKSQQSDDTPLLSEIFLNDPDRFLKDSENDTWKDKYAREVFKLYLKHGTIRNVTNVSKIPQASVAKAIKSCVEKIKREIKSELK